MEQSCQAIDDLSDWSSLPKKSPALIAARAAVGSGKNKITSSRRMDCRRWDFVSNYYQNGYPNQVTTTKSNTTTWGVTIITSFLWFLRETIKFEELKRMQNPVKRKCRIPKAGIKRDRKSTCNATSSFG